MQDNKRGRPTGKIFTERQLQVYLPADLDDHLRGMAQKRGISKTAYIRRLLAADIERQ